MCVSPTRMIIGCTLPSFWLWRCISPPPRASYRTLRVDEVQQQQQRDISHFRPLRKKKSSSNTRRRLSLWLFSRPFFPQLSNLVGCDEEPRCFTTLRIKYVYALGTRFEFIIFVFKQPLARLHPSDGFYLLAQEINSRVLPDEPEINFISGRPLQCEPLSRSS